MTKVKGTFLGMFCINLLARFASMMQSSRNKKYSAIQRLSLHKSFCVLLSNVVFLLCTIMLCRALGSFSIFE